MNFNELVTAAKPRVETADFRGLFSVGVLLTPSDEIREALDNATVQKMNQTTGQYDTEIDQDKLDRYLASKMVRLDKLTVGKAMTLCGREMPDEVKERAKEPLAADPATCETLLAKVPGLSSWMRGRMRTLAADAARRDEAALGN